MAEAAQKKPPRDRGSENYGIGRGNAPGSRAALKPGDHGVPAELKPNRIANIGDKAVPAPPGNRRALVHGASTAGIFMELAAEMLPEILAANPHLQEEQNGKAIERYAVICARIAIAYEWLGTRASPLFSNRQRGTTHKLWESVERWESAADRAEASLAISPATRARYGQDVFAAKTAQDVFAERMKAKAAERDKDVVEGSTA